MSIRLCALLLAAAVFSPAEKLPLKVYTAPDGLAHNSVSRIVRDSHGYLWFCTSEGLSRFDGYEFHNYGRRDGLPHRDVHDLLETKGGEFWIATSGGLCRYQPTAVGRHRFQTYRVGEDDRASYMRVLLEDRLGRVWCGTDAGLFRLDRGRSPGERVLTRVDLTMPNEAWDDRVVSALMQDVQGDLWIGAGSGLYRLRMAGQVERFRSREGLPDNFITALLLDRQHHIWAVTHEGLCELVANPVAGRRVVETILGVRDGLGSNSVEALGQLADGTICAATKSGLSITRSDRATGSPLFSSYSMSHGLPNSAVQAIGEDAAGNLWIGTDGGGAATLVWSTFLTYTAADGLAGTRVDSIFEDEAGTLCVATRNGGSELFIDEFDGSRFRATRVNLPPEARLLDWGARSQCLARDRDGRLWIATSAGLYRYSSSTRIEQLRRRLPEARFREPQGLPAGPVLSVFVDSSGRIWASTTGKKNGLAQFDPRMQTFHSYPGTARIALVAIVRSFSLCQRWIRRPMDGASAVRKRPA